MWINNKCVCIVNRCSNQDFYEQSHLKYVLKFWTLIWIKIIMFGNKRQLLIFAYRKPKLTTNYFLLIPEWNNHTDLAFDIKKNEFIRNSSYALWKMIFFRYIFFNLHGRKFVHVLPMQIVMIYMILTETSIS